jgi:hypothetical protein
MKTLVKGGVSIYIFEDAEVVNIGSDSITVGDPLTLTIADCSSSDTVMHTSVTPPDDWDGCKYLFDGTTWADNPAWVAMPEEEEEAE